MGELGGAHHVRGIGRILRFPLGLDFRHAALLPICLIHAMARPSLPSRRPHSALFPWQSGRLHPKGRGMTDRNETFSRVAELIDPFNKKGIDLTDATTFAGDLEWDSLVVMDFVANVEDEF